MFECLEWVHKSFKLNDPCTHCAIADRNALICFGTFFIYLFTVFFFFGFYILCVLWVFFSNACVECQHNLILVCNSESEHEQAPKNNKSVWFNGCFFMKYIYIENTNIKHIFLQKYKHSHSHIHKTNEFVVNSCTKTSRSHCFSSDLMFISLFLSIHFDDMQVMICMNAS